jgi:hypothetical protein
MQFKTTMDLDDYIRANPNVEQLVIDGLSVLDTVTISNCPQLRRVEARNLKEVWIGCCPQFETFVGDDNLQTLHFYNLPNYEGPSTLSNSLTYLRVERCEKVKEIPELPQFLEDIVLIDNPGLSKVPDSVRSGRIFMVFNG